MQDLPAEHYIPAFGAIIAALGWVTTMATKLTTELWRLNQASADRRSDDAEKFRVAMEANARALEAIQKLVQEMPDVVRALVDDALRREAEAIRHRRGGSDGSGTH